MIDHRRCLAILLLGTCMILAHGLARAGELSVRYRLDSLAGRQYSVSVESESSKTIEWLTMHFPSVAVRGRAPIATCDIATTSGVACYGLEANTTTTIEFALDSLLGTIDVFSAPMSAGSVQVEKGCQAVVRDVLPYLGPVAEDSPTSLSSSGCLAVAPMQCVEDRSEVMRKRADGGAQMVHNVFISSVVTPLFYSVTTTKTLAAKVDRSTCLPLETTTVVDAGVAGKLRRYTVHAKMTR